ncbi:hypothetical protein K490DRAFT_55868 [Saccharata proteae CBS 121410]|uniref:Elongin-A n=1 Tax=Saccharata proteae CBS 121410 TaxID=1314787 RepID=A0A9P4HXY2_9PEZI|nr:hypothetical protein K490DRAFT_55868 [Saccharata proteae CBS 121410]
MALDPQGAHTELGAPSLLDICLRKSSRCWKTITDVGLLPYRLVLPILRKIENPDQLRSIEVHSPHIAEDSGHLWEAFIKRDFSHYQSQLQPPKDPRNWWKVYKKFRTQQEKDIELQKAQLKARLQGIKAKKDEMTTSVTDKVNPRYLEHRPRTTFGGWGDRPAKDSTHFNVGPGGKRTLSGKGFLSQVQKKSNDHWRLRAPSHARIGRVAEAPRSMLSNGARPMPVDNGTVAVRSNVLSNRARPMPVDNGTVAVRGSMRPGQVQAPNVRRAAPAITSTRPSSTPTRPNFVPTEPNHTRGAPSGLDTRTARYAKEQREWKARKEERLKATSGETASRSASSAAGSKRQNHPDDADDRAAKRRREDNPYSARR